MAAHKLPFDLLNELDADYLLSLVQKAPDWQAALVAGTILEAYLEIALTIRFEQSMSKNDRAELFSGYGPLATFSGKIAVGYALGVMSKNSRHDLQLIKAIRNDAAHRTQNFTFEEAAIAKNCKKLIGLRVAGQLNPDLEEKLKTMAEKVREDTNRASFLRASFYIIVDIKITGVKYILDVIAYLAIGEQGAEKIIAEKFPDKIPPEVMTKIHQNDFLKWPPPDKSWRRFLRHLPVFK